MSMYKCCFLACFCASQGAGWLRDKLTSADGPCWTVGGASLVLPPCDRLLGGARLEIQNAKSEA